MGRIRSGLLALASGTFLSFFPGCSSNTFFHSLVSPTTQESLADKDFRKAYPELRTLLKENHFRRALAWVSSWESHRDLSSDNLKLLQKDKKTIRLIGASYYMGIAKESSKTGRLHRALEALDTARSFTPQDSNLRREIEKTKAELIISGEEGEDWGELLRKLLALKAKNPAETAIDPTIGWAYGKLAESEYMSGRYGLALNHARKALAYQKSNEVAVRISDRVSEMVRKLVNRAEVAYRDRRYTKAKEDLEKALTTDPLDRRARKDWQILSETPGGVTSHTNNIQK